MTTKSKLVKGKEYIYYLSRPEVIEYIGMHVDEPVFKDAIGERFKPSTYNIYDPDMIEKKIARRIVRKVFE